MKPFTKTGIALFGIMAAIHLSRLVIRWDVMVSETEIPVWISAVGFGLFFVIAAGMWRETKGEAS